MSKRYRRKNNTFAFYAITVLLIVATLGTLGGVTDSKLSSSERVERIPSMSLGNGGDEIYISFLGDSITTYAGYSDNVSYNASLSGSKSYYKLSKMSVQGTWWYQSMTALGMKLCVNNSFSAGRVSERTSDIPSGVERSRQLHNASGKTPDVIVVYLGTNDIGNGIELSVFETAYEEMLSNIATSYPKATVYCCTLLPEGRTEGKETELNEYNAVIRSSSEKVGFEIIDFYAEISDWDYMQHTFEDVDLRVHPNALGMDKLAACVISAIKGQNK